MNNRKIQTLIKMAFKVIALTALALCVNAQQICEEFGSTIVANRYVVMNNRWGTSAEHCIEVQGKGFRIVRQDGQGANGGPPVSYPAIFYGCHYTNCSPGTVLPRRLNQIGSISSKIDYTYVNNAVFDAAYDIWLDPNPNTSTNNAQEIMIWLNRQGQIQPIGSVVATISIAGRDWQVWTGSNGSNQVVSYLANNPTNTLNFNVMDFLNDAKGRGFYNDQWYLTSIQAGFEPWSGGVGLAVNDFDVQIN